jgi:hypothetical protein
MNEAKALSEAISLFQASPDPIKCVRGGTRKTAANLEQAKAFFDYFKSIPATNEIVLFFHCGLCLKEKPAGVSPRDWAQLEAGFTPHGIQLWCRRHECNVIHIDFQGQTHPANKSIHQDGTIIDSL